MPNKKRQARRGLEASFAGAGFTFPFPVRDLIDRAIRTANGDTSLAYTLAYSYIIQSKRFHNYYPGIFRPNGTLRMSPASYEAYIDQSRAAARSAGFTVTREQLGGNIQRNVSPQEFAFKIQAANAATRELSSPPDI